MRITQKDLESLVSEINTLTGNPQEPYDHSKPGCNPNACCYHIDSAYGGVQLVQMSSRQGCTGTRNITGRGTKRELYNELKAIVTGIEMAKGSN